MENGVPPHFHTIDRVSEKDIIPDNMIYASLPVTAEEGRKAVKLTGSTYDFYQFLNGAWRQMSPVAGSGGAKSVTKIVGPSANSDSSSYDYVTDGTDDNVQIQAAIDALPNTGGEVKLREGTYTLGSAALFINKDGVTLSGVGKGTIVTCKNSFNQSMLFFGHASIQYSNAVVRDIYFDGNKTNQSGGSYYILDNANLTKSIINFQVLNCYLTNALGVGALTSSTTCLIHGNYFKDWISTGTAVTVSLNSIVTNNHFTTSLTTGACITGGSYLVNGNTCVLPNGYNSVVISGAFINQENFISIGSSAGSSCKGVSNGFIVSNNYISFGSSANVAAKGIDDGGNKSVIGFNYIIPNGAIPISATSVSTDVSPNITS